MENERVPILFMIPLLYGYAGTEKHLLSIVSNIDRKRFIPHVCYFRGSKELVGLFEEKNVVCEKFEMERIYGFRAIKNMWKINKYIRKNRIKILQTFHPKGDLYGPLVGRMSGTPIIISSRRDLGFNRKNITIQKGINYLVQYMIAPSKAVKKVVIEKENVSEDKVRVIYNGVDTEYFKPEKKKFSWRSEERLQNSNFIITIIANLHKIKGVEYFIRAASLIAQKIPESRFIIIGNGSEKDFLKKLAVQFGIFEKIIFTGIIDNIKDYLAVSDAYICSSLSEGFSNSILEAMAMGLPVVATDVGGNQEAVADGESGFIVPTQDYQEIASKVIELYRNHDLRNEMGAKGRIIVEERFTLERMLREHEKLYLDLIDQMV